MQRTKGLTLIEILIALMLLGVLVSFVVSSLAGSFQITRENRKSLDATTTAQRIIEDIRGQWSGAGTKAVYNTACANVTLTPPNVSFMSLTATQTPLALDATPTGTPTAAVTVPCGALSVSPTCTSPMKRVVVVATDTADTTRVLSRVTLDVVCPEFP